LVVSNIGLIKNVIKIAPFFLLSRSLSDQSFVVNKCADSQEVISFRDKPCPDEK
jgi:hypothetical protein